MKPVFRWSLKNRKWFIIWWVIAIGLFVFINLIFYPTVKSQRAEFEKSFSQLSDQTTALFSDTGDLFSPIGYLSGQVFYLMLPLLLGGLAIGLGSSLIGREERDGTIELLLSRPISRTKLIVAKANTGVAIVAIVGLVSTLATAIMSKVVGLEVAFWNILGAGLATTILALSFGAVALMITMLGRGAKAASIGIAAVFALAGYILVSLSSNVEWLKVPSKAFAFNYYKPAEILRGDYNWANMLFILAVILACGLISWAAFRRRDLTGS